MILLRSPVTSMPWSKNLIVTRLTTATMPNTDRPATTIATYIFMVLPLKGLSMRIIIAIVLPSYQRVDEAQTLVIDEARRPGRHTDKGVALDHLRADVRCLVGGAALSDGVLSLQDVEVVPVVGEGRPLLRFGIGK